MKVRKMDIEEIIGNLRNKPKLTKEERIALNAQRVMERIFDGDYGETILAPPGMELWKYGFRKMGKADNHQRWITKEADNARKRIYYHKRKQPDEISTTS